MGVRDQLGVDLARAGSGNGGLQTVSVRVVDVRGDGKVNVDWGGALLVGVPCTDAYRGRAAGDVVAMRPGQRPVVLWRVGPDPGGTDEASIRAIAEDAARDVQTVQSVTWGTSLPTGSGWQQATTPWVRTASGGGVELYMQLANAAKTQPAEPTPIVPPPPAKLTADALRSWRSGVVEETSSTVRQGDPDGQGAWRGGWFYGTQIADACAGVTPASMTIRVARAAGGAAEKVPIRFYLHGETAPPAGQLDLGEGPEDLARLSAGGETSAALPASWRSALASGTARGIAVAASSTAEYAALTGGRIDITFST